MVGGVSALACNRMTISQCRSVTVEILPFIPQYQLARKPENLPPTVPIRCGTSNLQIERDA